MYSSVLRVVCSVPGAAPCPRCSRHGKQQQQTVLLSFMCPCPSCPSCPAPCTALRRSAVLLFSPPALLHTRKAEHSAGGAGTLCSVLGSQKARKRRVDSFYLFSFFLNFVLDAQFVAKQQHVCVRLDPGDTQIDTSARLLLRKYTISQAKTHH